MRAPIMCICALLIATPVAGEPIVVSGSVQIAARDLGHIDLSGDGFSLIGDIVPIEPLDRSLTLLSGHLLSTTAITIDETTFALGPHALQNAGLQLDFVWDAAGNARLIGWVQAVSTFGLPRVDLVGHGGVAALSPLRLDMVRDAEPIPEPSTMLLIGTGVIGLIASRRRK